MTDTLMKAVERAKVEHFGPNADAVPCRDCNGGGHFIDSQMACCGNLNAGGECRVDCVIEQRFERPCQRCDATGQEPS